MQLGPREINKNIFKAYDIRGLYPQEIDDDAAYRIARAYVSLIDCKRVVVSHDMRESADQFEAATIRGLIDQGADVVPVGLASTPMYYFAVNHLKGDAGVQCSASHNPAEYQGYKMTGPGAIPSIALVDNETLYKRACEGNFAEPKQKGTLHEQVDVLDAYCDAVLDSVDIHDFKDLKMVIDCANGMGGHILPVLCKKVGSDPVRLYWRLDGSFPNHEANPLKTETLLALRDRVVDEQAYLGVAFDGDGDRVAFTDEKGGIIPGDFITALIARAMLEKNPGETILYDLRSSWIVPEEIEKAGGKAIECRVGHGLIKKQMREEGGFFAGELSSHYYFSDFFTTDNGDLAMLYVIKMLLADGRPMSEIVDPLRRYFHSGEINSDVKDIPAVLKRLKDKYGPAAKRVTEIDGYKAEFEDWWFNVRPSNTEPLIRLNLEAKNKAKMEEKVAELLNEIRS
ncbi:MAG: phosphomannomutase/phosphoglucomutase [Armatimonadetes bacterium]|jgi:phosphomannomutase|nr:phosphomannomutase/phosphoglucomutase [Armatimonadota bacterium]